MQKKWIVLILLMFVFMTSTVVFASPSAAVPFQTEEPTQTPTITPAPLLVNQITYGDYAIVTMLLGLCGVTIIGTLLIFITLLIGRKK